MKKRNRTRLTVAICVALGAALLCLQLPGAKFAAQLCAALAGMLSLLGLVHLWAGKSLWGVRCQALLLATLCAGALTFAVLEGTILSHAAGDQATPADAVLVLGAGVNGTVPSLALQTRIDAAAAYLHQHPGIPAVLSGGQGPGEDVTEAQAMYTALTAKGIDPKRLLLEERSTSTVENFAYSQTLLREAGVDTETAVIAVVSNDFHLYRAERIARSLELETVGIPAPLPWFFLSANYYIREAFALANTLLFQLR